MGGGETSGESVCNTEVQGKEEIEYMTNLFVAAEQVGRWLFNFF